MKSIKVLLLDDDVSLRFNMEMYLSDEGFETKSADNADLALNLLEKNKFDVAIVDIRLPGLNGEEFIKLAIKKYPRLKFIIYTGSIKYYIPNDLKEIGITKSQIFIKPISDMKKFVKKIRSLAEDV